MIDHTSHVRVLCDRCGRLRPCRNGEATVHRHGSAGREVVPFVLCDQCAAVCVKNQRAILDLCWAVVRARNVSEITPPWDPRDAAGVSHA